MVHMFRGCSRVYNVTLYMITVRRKHRPTLPQCESLVKPLFLMLSCLWSLHVMCSTVHCHYLCLKQSIIFYGNEKKKLKNKVFSVYTSICHLQCSSFFCVDLSFHSVSVSLADSLGFCLYEKGFTWRYFHFIQILDQQGFPPSVVSIFKMLQCFLACIVSIAKSAIILVFVLLYVMCLFSFLCLLYFLFITNFNQIDNEVLFSFYLFGFFF